MNKKPRKRQWQKRQEEDKRRLEHSTAKPVLVKKV